MLAGGFRHRAILAFARGGREGGGGNVVVMLCGAQLLCIFDTFLLKLPIVDVICCSNLYHHDKDSVFSPDAL